MCVCVLAKLRQWIQGCGLLELFSFSGSHLMISDPSRTTERLFVSLHPLLSQFSVALVEEFLLHSGCTLRGPTPLVPLSLHFHQNTYTSLSCLHAWYTTAGCTYFALHCRIHPWINNNSAEITLYRFLPLCSVWASFCFPRVLNWKLALLCG